jgi:hypothetical protein
VATRHLQSTPVPLRAGRALISFTRVARDQIARRCRQAGRSDLVQVPHFIGTFDSFVWEFLVNPLRPADPAPRLLESWGAVKAPVTGLDRAMLLGQFPLSIDVTDNGMNERVAWELVDADTERTLADSAYNRTAWQEAILTTRNHWCQRGYYTGHEARYRALWHLRTPAKAQWLVPPLLSRFAEVIVDEAQDCSAADLAILGHLHDAGLPLILVGDPDQAIYAWRGAEPQALQDFATRINAATVRLTGNRQFPCDLPARARPTPQSCGRTPSRSPFSLPGSPPEAASISTPAAGSQSSMPSAPTPSGTASSPGAAC